MVAVLKRILALFLTLLLLVPCLTIPASATTQGVIDAIEDLQAGLGTSQRDILDAINDMWDGLATDIWYVIDSIDDNFVDLLDTALPGISNDLDNIHSKLTSIDTYFFTNSVQTVYFPKKVTNTSGNSHWEYVGQGLYITGFERSLMVPVEQLGVWFCDIANAIIGDTTKSDQFDDDKAPVETQVDEWVEELETAPTISLEGMDVVLGGELQLDESYTGFLRAFLDNYIIFISVILSFILACVGYLLYGKR